MRTTILFICFIAFISHSSAQNHLHSDEIVFSGEKKNIMVQKLSSDNNSTSFAIQIEDSVAAHYHQNHTESLIVIEGSAEMRLGDKVIIVEKGDFITIPAKTVHAVKVKSKEPLKVISIQAPEFFGEDRHFINK